VGERQHQGRQSALFPGLHAPGVCSAVSLVLHIATRCGVGFGSTDFSLSGFPVVRKSRRHMLIVRRAHHKSLCCYAGQVISSGTRQRRGACQPGATPRGTRSSIRSALQGRRIPAPFQGAPTDSETQGVALGWSAPALSAPDYKLCKSEFSVCEG